MLGSKYDKGSTINDMGAEEKYIMNLFFLQECSLKFSHVEGPSNFFFLDFLRPHPQIINGRPLNRFNYTEKNVAVSRPASQLLFF